MPDYYGKGSFLLTGLGFFVLGLAALAALAGFWRFEPLGLGARIAWFLLLAGIGLVLHFPIAAKYWDRNGKDPSIYELGSYLGYLMTVVGFVLRLIFKK